MPESEYEQRIKARMFSTGDRNFEKLHQTCAKKLLDGVVDFAKELGFAPHPDYKNAYELFGNIDAGACPVKYTYGKNGKPFYMNGPYESPADIERIINTLTKKCGPDGFHTLKEYRKRNGSGAVYDDPRVAVGAGRFDEVGARAEA